MKPLQLLPLLLVWPVEQLAIAFQPPVRLPGGRSRAVARTPLRSPRLHARGSFDKNSYLQKPEFDLLSFRTFRRSVLLQYSSTNQSEPLRILLYLTATFILLSASAFADLLNAPLEPPASYLTVVAAAGTGFLFNRERGFRTNQLNRMELEAGLADLEIVETDAATGSRRRYLMQDLRGERRTLVLYGPSGAITAALRDAATFRRRFVESKLLLIVVPTDGKTLQVPTVDNGQPAMTVAEATGRQQWVAFVTSLLANRNGAQSEDAQGGEAYIALNFNGRSVSSGPDLGAINWDELLGSRFPPVEIFAASENPTLPNLPGANSPEARDVLEALQEFYRALREGDLPTMLDLFLPGAEQQLVSGVIAQGGRLDNWEFCLQDGARPDSIVIAEPDVVLLSGDSNRATSSCIEFPSGTGGRQTLLASQTWAKDENGRWRLVLHRTIPFAVNVGAGGLLRCDCRGCVALTATKERQTQGGVIG